MKLSPLRSFNLNCLPTMVRGAACVAALLSLGLPATRVSGQALIVLPLGLEDTDGDTSAFGGPAPELGVRAQQAFVASDFAGLPAGHDTIVSMAWRPDFTVTSTKTQSLNLELRLSTTTAAPSTGNMSVVFADNIGDDETLVYSGPITFTTPGSGDPEGPRPFDYLIEFQTPFHYDPAEGNLLVEHKFIPPFEGNPLPGAILADAHESGALAVVATGDASAATGSAFSNRLVTQFGFIPEPQAITLLVIGLVSLLVRRQP